MFKFKYFQGRISRGFVSLYTARTILRVAGGLLGLFLPIFLYELFDFDLKYVFCYFLVGHFIYATLVAYGCKHLNKVGLKRSLMISIVWGAIYYFSLYLISSANLNFVNDTLKTLILLSVSILFITLMRLMYWVPLHTDLAKFTNKKNRGKQLSLMEATSVALGAIMPLIAGWIVSKFGYDILFILAVLIYLITLIPMITLPRTRERFSWTYLQTWKEFLSKERRKGVIAYLGDGAESVVGVVIWPIFIWELLSGNYFEVGVLSSIVVIITVVIQLITGKFADLADKKKILKYSTVLYAIGWIVKIFIVTAFQIFVASAYHSIVRIFTRTSFDTLQYESSADQGHYVDEYTVIHEMAIQYGKVLMLALSIILVSFFNIQWTFILAALASLSLSLITQEHVNPGKRNKERR